MEQRTRHRFLSQSSFVDSTLREDVLCCGKLQKKEAIKKCSKDIISKTRDVDGLITRLFTSFCLTGSDKQRLDTLPVSEDKLALLVELIQADEKGEKSEKFLQALFTSTNTVLCKFILHEAKTRNQKWLEIQKLGRDLIQQHYQRLKESIRDVDSVIAEMRSGLLISPCRGQTPQEKIGDLLQKVQKGDIATVLYFVNHLEHGINNSLFKLLQRSVKLAEIKSKSQELVTDISSNMKRKLCDTFKHITPIPGNSFRMNVMTDRDTLLKLNVLVHFPKKVKARDGSENCNWNNGEEVYVIRDSDRLFQRTLKRHRVTIVQGVPGSGKTVFLQRWAIDWACDPEHSDTFIVYIPVRAVHSKDLLAILFDDLMFIAKEFQTAFHYFIHNSSFQNLLTFLIDGVDEQISTLAESDIWKLITGELLPEANVVVTTRMYESILEKLKPYANAIVTLNGVTEKSRETFIQHMLGDTSGLEDVQSFIKRCKQFLFDSKVLGVPIYLALLCVLAQEHCIDNSLETLAIPRTRLDMYNTFADVFEKRYFALSNEYLIMNKHMQESIPLIKHLIGRMSFYNLVEEEHVFTLKNLRDNYLEESLIQRIGYFIEGNKGKDHSDRTYTFCHKTFQEYFAGIFCAKIGFPKTAMHLMTSGRGIFNNQRILAGLENVCIRNKWQPMEIHSVSDETKTLEASFQQVVTAVQFAAGISPEFAKSVFLYGICACHLQFNIDRYKNPAFHTQFESSLVFESKDITLMEDYVTYLIRVKKHKAPTLKATIPDNYSDSMYQYICEAMPKHLKCRLLNELYEVRARVCWNIDKESILIESKGHKTDDTLLSYLIENELPSMIVVSGGHVDLQLVTSALDQTTKIRHLEIGNTDLSAVGPDLWDKFLSVLTSQTVLEVLKLPFCRLQSYQMENIFDFLNKKKCVRIIDISGNSLGNITEKSLAIIAPVVEKHCTEISICNNFIADHDWKSSLSGRSVIHNDVYIASFARFLEYHTILKALSIDRSALNDFQSEQEWKVATEKLGNCKGLESLQLTACKLTEDYHLQNLCTVFGFCQSLQVLDFSHNNFGNIECNSWKEFAMSISQLQCLKYLKLSRCRLVQSYHIDHLCTVFRNIPKLTTLDLSRNNFGKCPKVGVTSFVKCLANLQHLENLDFSTCELRHNFILQHLGATMSIMKKLTDVNLSENNFENVESLIWCKFLGFSKYTSDLTVMKLSCCGLTKSYHLDGVSHLVGNCTQLQTVDLSGNNFSGIDDKSLDSFCIAIAGNSSLESLNFANCHVTKSHLIKKLATAISKHRNLKHFSIERNTMQHVTSADWHCLIAALGETSVQTLNLAKCGLQLHHFESNATCLNILHQLRHLDISQIALGRIAQHDWTVFIGGMKHCKNLEYLNLWKNSLCGDHLDSLGETLASLHDTIVYLNLGDNNIGESGNKAWDVFTKGLRACTKVKEMNISKCGVHSNHQVERLGNAVQHLNQLHSLHISENDLYVDEGPWSSFAESLKFCRLLKRLNISNCKLCQDFHYHKLGIALGYLTHLQHINISGNHMSNVQSWKFIMSGINCCKQVRCLQLSNCGLNTEAHVTAMIPVLHALPRLTVIVLSKNGFVLESIRELIKALSMCCQLREIDLRGCKVKLTQSCLKWHAGHNSATVKLYAESVLDKIAKET